jgi:hypothetical protein
MNVNTNMNMNINTNINMNINTNMNMNINTSINMNMNFCMKKIGEDTKTVDKSLYYVIHKDGYCERHKNGSYTIMNKNTDEKCKSRVHNITNINNQYPSDQRLPFVDIKIVDIKNKCITTFYDDKNMELDLYYESDKEDKFCRTPGYSLYDILNTYLDKTIKYNVIAVSVDQHIKLGMALMFTIQIGDMKEEQTIHRYKYNKDSTTKQEILDHVKNLQNDPFYNRYDLSNITIDDISIGEPNDVCLVL